MKRFALLLLGLGLACSAPRNPAPWAPAPNVHVVEASLAEWLRGRSHVARSGVEVTVETELADAYRVVLRRLLTGDLDATARSAAGIGQRLVEIRDTGRRYVALVEARPEGVGPIVVMATSPWREIIAEAPHPSFEPGTGGQAIRLVTEAGARAAIVAGAERCASSAEAGCDGRTSVCNEPPGPPPRPYRASDVAHSPATLFHVAHQVLSDHWHDALVVQLHAMARGRREVHPPDEQTWFVVSGGPGARPGDPPRSVLVRDELRGLARGGDVRAVSCQDPRDQERFGHRKLCGTRNVQGRHLAGHADVCRSVSSELSGRFLHIEQRFTPVLDQPELQGLAVDALTSVAPCLPDHRDVCRQGQRAPR